jgi:NitT/TauT family transport system permease protein
MNQFFKLRGTLPSSKAVPAQILGALLGILAWHFLAVSGIVPNGILSPPLKVLTSFRDLLHDGVLWHAAMSIKLNFIGYVEAVAICIPLGFLLGLYPLPEVLSERLLASARFLPLPAALGLFIAAFGIGTTMKVQFLAVGIIMYLLPTMVVQVKKTQDVYIQTAQTLGASDWQIIRHVFFPDVMGRVFDDIRVLVAISWTYITIAEVVNSSEGGLGALGYIAGRQSRVDKIYAILIIIAVIGLIQDWSMRKLDRWLFKYKYA